MSESLNKNNCEMPPVAERRDLNKEVSERLLNLEFERIEGYPELKTTATIATEELNKYRLQFGLEPIQLDDDTVRLISEKIYDADPLASESSPGGGFLDPISRRIFLKFNAAEYHRSTFKKMHAVYVVNHELAHRAMQKTGLSQSVKNEIPTFFSLNEGIADWLAKKSLMMGSLARLLLQKIYNHVRVI